VSGDVRTPPKFAATLSDDPAIREVQQYLLSLNSGLLNQTALAASDWRWAQVNASGTSTWALQYRTPPSTWTTIAYFGPTGTLSTAAGGSLPSGGTANQVLTRTATASEWANGSKATLTTTGDLLYASAANTPARLAAGTSGYVLTANGAGVAPSWQAAAGGLTTLYEVDFTTQTTQDFKAGGDGNYTIDGKNWKVTGTGASAGTFKILNGTGIVLAPNAVGAEALGMRASLYAMSSTCAPTLAFTEVWYRATVANLTTNLQSGNCGLTNYSGTSTDWLCRMLQLYDGSQAWVADYYYNGVQLAAGSRPRSTNSLTDDVIVLRVIDSATVEVFTGVYSSGWPARAALHRRGVLQLFVPSAAAIKSPEVNDFAASISAYAFANGSSMTVTNMRVMQ